MMAEQGLLLPVTDEQVADLAAFEAGITARFVQMEKARQEYLRLTPEERAARSALAAQAYRDEQAAINAAMDLALSMGHYLEPEDWYCLLCDAEWSNPKLAEPCPFVIAPRQPGDPVRPVDEVLRASSEKPKT